MEILNNLNSFKNFFHLQERDWRKSISSLQTFLMIEILFTYENEIAENQFRLSKQLNPPPSKKKNKIK